jgi:hypothetical protein
VNSDGKSVVEGNKNKGTEGVLGSVAKEAESG